MADALISVILDQFASITAREAEQEIKLVVGVDEEVRKLEGNLRTVQAVLNDAEKRQVTDKSVKLWLKKLEDVSYEMDDVLDEWNTAMIKLEIEKDEEENAENAHVVKKKVCSFIPSPSCCLRQVDKFVLRHDIAHKIKELNGKLDEIVRERGMYGFKLTRGPSHEVVKRPESTSFVDVSEICGRDKVRKNLLSILFGKKGSEEEKNPDVISLVGMGGIGKTTLAQLAYNDNKVETHFEKRMWVCASEPFDQHTVAKAIITTIEKNFNDNNTKLQVLMEKISELIEKKKFFLVLDDVWTEEPTLWEPFRLALKKGAQGSRILVTTRKIRVAEIMGSTSVINLEVLSDEDCWLVFSKIAFSGKTPEKCDELEVLGRQIAKKCKGLPLAAKTLGSLMGSKKSSEQWKNVLDSNLWDLKGVENVIEKDLFASLFLSYYDLPSPLKRCFSYCAIYPKDYVFSSDELVEMWMAQGYIDSEENMEIIARDYLENLAIRSFFQDFEKDEDNGEIIAREYLKNLVKRCFFQDDFEKDEDDGQIRRCKMHDIVHDFAQLMSKNECFTINSDMKMGLDYKNARHLYLEGTKKGEFPVSIYNAKNLRTLIIKDFWDDNLFQHFRCLRSLTLDCEERNIPDTFKNFIHLRYLNLRGGAKGLPKTIYNLCNLQILKIQFSGTTKVIPHGIGKLINLRHLILYNVWGERLPRASGPLASLRRSSHFYVSGTKDGCKLGELKDLNQLQGSLDINGLGYVVDVCEAENAQLKKKIHLHTLKLQFYGDYGIVRRKENDESVLNALESPPNLKYLSIEMYQGTKMSHDWTMSLTNLETLHLDSFENLKHLPPLGKLPVLKSLKIKGGFHSVRKVGVEFLGIESEKKKEDNMQIFPNLKSLEFRNFVMWEKWIGIEEMKEEEEDSNITIMPRLQRLVILDCPCLKSLPDFLRTVRLEELEINHNQIHTARCQRGIRKEWPKISHIPNIKIYGKYVQRDGQAVKSEIYGKYVQRDGQAVKSEDDENIFFRMFLALHKESNEEEHAEEEFDKEASSSTMNLHD